MAGLGAAVRAAGQGIEVFLHEASPNAGGRCRSHYEPVLDRTIDNGNHLMLSGNRAVMRYSAAIGASDRLEMAARATFPFVDLATGNRWTVAFGNGRWPYALLARKNRVPQTRIIDYLRIINLLRANSDASVEDTVGTDGHLFELFLRPLSLAVLNTPPEKASASLMAAVVRETMLKGGRACRPVIARTGLSDALVEPALAMLERSGVRVATGSRLRAIEMVDGAPRALRFSREDIAITPDDAIILAVPAPVAADMLGRVTPDRFEPIVNAHFRVNCYHMHRTDRHQRTMTGVLGGTAEWFLVRDDVVSVTVSAARTLVHQPAEKIAALLWADVSAALAIGNPAKVPACAVVKERRATFSQTPEQCRRRPDFRAVGSGLFLAGDWTETGLPATIEGALRSGERAEKAALQWIRQRSCDNQSKTGSR